VRRRVLREFAPASDAGAPAAETSESREEPARKDLREEGVEDRRCGPTEALPARRGVAVLAVGAGYSEEGLRAGHVADDCLPSSEISSFVL
jgi:hypothetical protein